jgi:tRNA A37 threonylcarbamoyladenosine biosynthesis protein TsaE
MDLYRLSKPEEVGELGWEALGAERELVLVEWPERAEAFLPPVRWDVTLARAPGSPLLRDLEVRAEGTPSPIPPLSVAAATFRTSAETV